LRTVFSGSMLTLLLTCGFTLAGGFRSVTATPAILGDVNGDGIVNLRDVAIMAAAWGTTPGDFRWNELADVNKDGVVNLRDLLLVAMGFGETVGAESQGVLAGWRSSPYGLQQQADPDYWIDVAKNMSSKLSNSTPSGVWILGEMVGQKCQLTFPSSNSYPNVVFSRTDENEKYLDAFDAAGLRVWLQVEPADADVQTLINLVLGRYHQHSCLLGFGVDVEWLGAGDYSEGRPVTNEEAQAWLSEVKSYNSTYKLFLKHWLVEKMPSAHIADVLFVDDSQEYSSMNGLVHDFKDWGTHFSRSEVCFQIGYESDREWWSNLTDPYQTISDTLIDEIPNCRGVYWVDFTLQTVYSLDSS
jgi:hypothetical protein